MKQKTSTTHRKNSQKRKKNRFRLFAVLSILNVLLVVLIVVLFPAAFGNDAKTEEKKAHELLCRLFEHFEAHPNEMPRFYYEQCEKEGVKRMVCDYIAGMTDRYAIDTYRRLFIPQVWKGKLHD